MKPFYVRCPTCAGKGTVIGLDRVGTYRQIGCPTCAGETRVRFIVLLDFLAWVIVGSHGDRE